MKIPQQWPVHVVEQVAIIRQLLFDHGVVTATSTFLIQELVANRIIATYAGCSACMITVETVFLAQAINPDDKYPLTRWVHNNSSQF